MTAPPPRRPWWRRKRTWAAVALWLVAAYPVSLGRAAFLTARYDLPFDTLAVAYAPVIAVINRCPALDEYANWVILCGLRGSDDRAAASDRAALIDTTFRHRPR